MTMHQLPLTFSQENCRKRSGSYSRAYSMRVIQESYLLFHLFYGQGLPCSSTVLFRSGFAGSDLATTHRLTPPTLTPQLKVKNNFTSAQWNCLLPMVPKKIHPRCLSFQQTFSSASCLPLKVLKFNYKQRKKLNY